MIKNLSEVIKSKEIGTSLFNSSSRVRFLPFVLEKGNNPSPNVWAKIVPTTIHFDVTTWKENKNNSLHQTWQKLNHTKRFKEQNRNCRTKEF